MELRDCYILSVKDPAIIQSEKDMIIQAELEGKPNPKIKEVKDCCFCIKKVSLNPKIQNQFMSTDFMGVLSLQSTTISDFHYGILGDF